MAFRLIGRPALTLVVGNPIDVSNFTKSGEGDKGTAAGTGKSTGKSTDADGKSPAADAVAGTNSNNKPSPSPSPSPSQEQIDATHAAFVQAVGGLFDRYQTDHIEHVQRQRMAASAGKGKGKERKVRKLKVV
jgi:hypothetical protein